MSIETSAGKWYVDLQIILYTVTLHTWTWFQYLDNGPVYLSHELRMINNFSIFSLPEKVHSFPKVYQPLFSFIYISDAFSTAEKYERRIEADLGIPRDTFQMNMMQSLLSIKSGFM